MVANNFLGFSNKFETTSISSEPSSIPSSMSALVKEKSATSAPEIKAEQKSRTSNKILLSMTESLRPSKRKMESGGSMSKVIYLDAK